MNGWQTVPWQVWVLVSGVLTGLAQIIGKRQIHKISALQLGFIRDVSGLLLVLPIAQALGKGWQGWWSLVALLNGVILAVGVALYYKAVRTSLSGSTVFGYLVSQVMIVVCSAVVFAEWVYFNPLTGRGLGNLLVLGLTIAAMLSYVKSLKFGGKWIWLLMVSAAVNAGGSLLAKYLLAGEVDVWSYFLAQQVGITGAGAVILWVRKQGMRVGWKRVGVGVVQGWLAVMGLVIYLYSLVQYPLSLSSLVRRIAIVAVTSGSGLLLYKGSKGMGKRARVSLIMAAVAFLIVMWVNR